MCMYLCLQAWASQPHKQATLPLEPTSRPRLHSLLHTGAVELAPWLDVELFPVIVWAG